MMGGGDVCRGDSMETIPTQAKEELGWGTRKRPDASGGDDLLTSATDTISGDVFQTGSGSF